MLGYVKKELTEASPVRWLAMPSTRHPPTSRVRRTRSSRSEDPRLTGRNLHRSWVTIPTYEGDEADITELAVRKKLREKPPS